MKIKIEIEVDTEKEHDRLLINELVEQLVKLQQIVNKEE